MLSALRIAKLAGRPHWITLCWVLPSRARPLIRREGPGSCVDKLNLRTSIGFILQPPVLPFSPPAEPSPYLTDMAEPTPPTQPSQGSDTESQQATLMAEKKTPSITGSET